MKKFYIFILLLSFVTVGFSQNHITVEKEYSSQLVLPQMSNFSAYDIHENLLFAFTGDTIYCVDITSNEILNKFAKPEGYNAFASFLTLSPDAQRIYVGYTVSGNTDDRIYEVNVQTGEWKKIADLKANYDLVFWGDKMIVSALNSTDYSAPNAIFVLDTTSTQNHKKLIETGGYSSGLSVDIDNNILYGTNTSENNAVYRFSSEKVEEFLALEDTFLQLSEAEKLFDLDNGAGDIATDLNGNVFVNHNKWGEGGKTLLWNERLGLDTFKVVASSAEFLTNLVVNNSNTKASYPVELYQLAYGKPLTKIYQTVDYSDGIFVINEDWFGHSVGSVNFFTNDNQFAYRALQLENDSSVLGVTSQYGTIYGDNLYVVSKQGNRLVVADAQTLKVKKIIKEFVANNTNNQLDGRAFVGVTPEKGYVSTSNGICIFNIETLQIDGMVNNVEGEIGNMVRAGNNVIAVSLRKLFIIDAETNKVKKVISGGKYGGIAQTIDGNIWIGSGTELIKIDPNTLKIEKIEIPESAKTSTSEYAWNANSLSASATENALFWAKPAEGWAGSTAIVKYDLSNEEPILTEEFVKIEDDMELYGAGIRVHPENNKIYITAKNPGWGENFSINNLNVYNGNTGELISKNPMMKYYWFPAVIAFPDNHQPKISDEEIIIESGDYQSFLLTDIISDEDNNDAAIYATVSPTDQNLVNAVISGKHLIIQSVNDMVGSTELSIKAYSNGKVSEQKVVITVTYPTAVEELEQNNFSVYPNPFNQQITIDRVSNSSNGNFYLYTIEGKMMLNGTLTSSQTNISTSELPKGIYLLKVFSDNESFTKKLIK